MKDNDRFMSGSEEKGTGSEPIPLFDCLTHPTLNSNWQESSVSGCASLDGLVSEMKEYNVRWAFAVGLMGIGDYDEARYAGFVKDTHTGLFPIAFLDFSQIRKTADIRPLLKSIKKKGYIGIKIHPRISEISLGNPLLPYIISTAADMGLVAMLCTYFYGMQINAEANSPETLDALLHSTEGSKVILLHAGSVRLLETIEIARARNSVLLDLSFTLCKYEGSSLDLDLAYAFRNFDRRICLGSDHPEFSLRMLRQRFEHFAQGLEREKSENIAYKNLHAFTGVV